MRPKTPPTLCDDGGFLRPRGDAPPAGWTGAAAPTVPPPTRRCALPHLGKQRRKPGSSAHAEMRPTPNLCERWTVRFLRPRGDAPAEARRVFERLAVPPPTRRCARERGCTKTALMGSSAHAEMRPCVFTPGADDVRFLRPRGDAPKRSLGFAVEGQVPPPTRRCA